MTEPVAMDLLGYETGSPPLQRITAGGRVIGYRESGHDQKQAVVLLHGLGSAAASWGLQFVALPRHGLHVIGWDAPGYGGSDALADPAPAAADYAAALDAFVAALGLSRFVLVGHSMGTLIAASYARHYPSRVEKLVLASVSTGYAQAPEPLKTERTQQRLDDMAAFGPEGLAETRAPQTLSPQAPKRALIHVRAVMARVRPDGYAQAVRMLARTDIFDDAPKITVPTLVLCGSADTVTPEESCKRIAAAIPGARYRTLYGPGHACYIETPGPFDDALLSFIGEK